MDSLITTAAIPVFLLGMLIEWRVGTRTTRSRQSASVRPAYNFKDSITNVSCGIGSQLAGIFIGALGIVFYQFFERHALITSNEPSSPLTWTLGFLGVDLCFYWYHRASHRTSSLWATHVVHHQSEYFNLSVALRQPWFTGVLSWFFYVPLAACGVPLSVYLTCYGINLVYQFFIHTELVDRLGPLELVLNTPSHHRVHHGTNPIYIDKNYAGVLIIWDRLFGTFRAETEPPIYGITHPLRRFSPLVANVSGWADLLFNMQQRRGLHRLWPLVLPPERLNVRPGPPTSPSLEAAISTGARRTIITEFLTAVAILVVIMLRSSAWGLTWTALAMLPMFAILERWARISESPPSPTYRS